MIERLRTLADRPIAEHERRRAFALAAASVLIATARLLTLQAPDQGDVALRPAPAQPEPQAPAPAAPASPGAGRPGGVASREAESTARRFLEGYLAYLYGRGPVSAIRGATHELAGRLRRARPRISPATRRRRPRVIELSAQALGRNRELVVAQIADGDIAQYPIELVLEHQSGRWLVARVEAD